jgi:hypothetical protein
MFLFSPFGSLKCLDMQREAPEKSRCQILCHLLRVDVEDLSIHYFPKPRDFGNLFLVSVTSYRQVLYEGL